jgi:hypothetical protein
MSTKHGLGLANVGNIRLQGLDGHVQNTSCNKYLEVIRTIHQCLSTACVSGAGVRTELSAIDVHFFGAS